MTSSVVVQHNAGACCVSVQARQLFLQVEAVRIFVLYQLLEHQALTYSQKIPELISDPFTSPTVC